MRLPHTTTLFDTNLLGLEDGGPHAGAGQVSGGQQSRWAAADDDAGVGLHAPQTMQHVGL